MSDILHSPALEAARANGIHGYHPTPAIPDVAAGKERP